MRGGGQVVPAGEHAASYGGGGGGGRQAVAVRNHSARCDHGEHDAGVAGTETQCRLSRRNVSGAPERTRPYMRRQHAIKIER